MASNLYLPFSFYSTSTTTKTTSYTIPVGKYARVLFRVGARSTPSTVTVNGSVVLRSRTFTNTSYIGGNGNLFSLASYDICPPVEIELWLKAGDVINGSGSWRAIVTEFNSRQ